MTSGLETGYSFEPAQILEFKGLRGPLTIRGNGARLRCAPNLRYGTFAPGSGKPTHHPMPYLQGGQMATPYRAMIKTEDCLGPIAINDLELDGNVNALRIGGQYGDTGWQIPAVGIMLVNNRGSETLDRVYSHHHALDGLIIDGLDRSRGRAIGKLANVRCEYNGRQGCSIVGGRSYLFTNCKFNYTGRSTIATNPGAGVDIEAEAGKTVRDLSFNNCEFIGNTGAGMVADSGSSTGVGFTRCRFVGTTNWSAWPSKPGFRFTECTFIGAVVRAFASEDPRDATQFTRCTFTDDPAQSPGGLVYGGDGAVPMVDLGGSYMAGKNVAFRHCRFDMVAGGKLPWSVGSIYEDVTMVQLSKAPAYPRGIFRGRNSIRGPVDLYSSRIEGTLFVNGRPVSF